MSTDSTELLKFTGKNRGYNPGHLLKRDRKGFRRKEREIGGREWR
jgi:hypothetical protein